MPVRESAANIESAANFNAFVEAPMHRANHALTGVLSSNHRGDCLSEHKEEMYV